MNYRANGERSEILNRYFAGIRGFTVLTREEERDLARSIKGNKDAFDRFIESNLPFVVRIAREYRNRGIPFEDLLNEGNTGLIEAAHRYDPERGTKFVTYAVWWIRKNIIRAITYNSKNIRVPYYMLKKIEEVNKAEREIEATGEIATSEKIAKKMRQKPEKIDEYRRLRHYEVSLEETVDRDRETKLFHVLEDRTFLNGEEGAIRTEQYEQVIAVLQELPENERAVLKYRFGLYGEGPLTLKEIGEKMGVSRERVRQIEFRALRKTRLRIKKIETERQLNRTRKTNSNNGSGNNSHNHGQNVLASYPK